MGVSFRDAVTQSSCQHEMERHETARRDWHVWCCEAQTSGSWRRRRRALKCRSTDRLFVDLLPAPRIGAPDRGNRGPESLPTLAFDLGTVLVRNPPPPKGISTLAPHPFRRDVP